MRAMPAPAIATTTEQRLALVAAQLAGPVAAGVTSREALIDIVSSGVRVPRSSDAYLVLSVLTGEVPLAAAVERARRSWRAEGLAVLVAEVLRSRRFRRPAPVRVASGIVLDVTDTSRSPYTTGIQRVARESIARWPHDRIELLAFDPVRPRLRALTAEEQGRFPVPSGALGAPRAPRDRTVVVPFRATLVLPEIAVVAERYRALLTLARHSASRAVAIGFDCIPMTSAEYAAPGMPGAFANYLAALADFDEVVAISGPSAREYEGWKTMLAGAGIEGPRVSVAELPFDAGTADATSIAKTRSELALDPAVPVVLAVGSHEPRKNHLALLEACEELWQAGRTFRLVMVGGNSWNSDDFDALVEKLAGRGRPLTLLSRAGDDTVWALYRIARFSVFCSFNEGFGLPVAESLAAGTPVVTSNFGSMRELADGHGGLLVDPRDTPAIRGAIEHMLDDDALLAGLEGELASLPRSSWDEYAATVWGVVSPA